MFIRAMQNEITQLDREAGLLVMSSSMQAEDSLDLILRFNLM